jgi:hypothetical protein
MLPTALKLAAAGLAVFPCRPRDKRPATEHGCNDATRDPAAIKTWWKQQPDCNIGIATGAASGVFVVDIDDDGEIELRRLEVDHGGLPNSVEAITARGRHIFQNAESADQQFSRQDGTGNRRARQWRLRACAAVRTSVWQALLLERR